MEDDFSEKEESQFSEDFKKEEEINEEFIPKNKSSSKRASKRPIQREKETLDIEPLDDKKFISENQKAESVDIDDPW